MFRKANDACSYVSDKLLSRCTQVFNYHRLLTWDVEKGLHIDIFKVSILVLQWRHLTLFRPSVFGFSHTFQAYPRQYNIPHLSAHTLIFFGTKHECLRKHQSVLN